MDKQEQEQTERLRSRKERFIDAGLEGASIALGSFCAAFGMLLAHALFDTIRSNKSE